MYYALYQGKQKVFDENGLYTGEEAIVYSAVVKAKMNVGVDLGTAGLEQFGIVDPFTVAIVTDDTLCPITTTSILWLGFGDIPDYDDTATYTEGQYALKDGTIQQYANEVWEAVPHTHSVLRVSTSLNSVTYLARQVEVSYEDS